MSIYSSNGFSLAGSSGNLNPLFGGFIGRAAIMRINGVAVAGIRTKGFSWSGESVDMTCDQSGGVRVLDDKSGQEQIDIPIDGILKSNQLLDIIKIGGDKKIIDGITLTFGVLHSANTTGAILSGDFRLSGFEVGMPYNDAGTFSCTLESTGVWSFVGESA